MSVHGEMVKYVVWSIIMLEWSNYMESEKNVKYAMKIGENYEKKSLKSN